MNSIDVLFFDEAYSLGGDKFDSYSKVHDVIILILINIKMILYS